MLKKWIINKKERKELEREFDVKILDTFLGLFAVKQGALEDIDKPIFRGVKDWYDPSLLRAHKMGAKEKILEYYQAKKELKTKREKMVKAIRECLEKALECDFTLKDDGFSIQVRMDRNIPGDVAIDDVFNELPRWEDVINSNADLSEAEAEKLRECLGVERSKEDDC